MLLLSVTGEEGGSGRPRVTTEATEGWDGGPGLPVPSVFFPTLHRLCVSVAVTPLPPVPFTVPGDKLQTPDLWVWWKRWLWKRQWP